MIDEVHKKSPKEPMWSCLYQYYNFCPLGIITEDSKEFWNIYCNLDGLKRMTFKDYGDTPVVYIDACNVIDKEINRIQKSKEK